MTQRPVAERVGVVIATRDRAGNLLGTLERLRKLEERPPIVVVDNGSTDGTPELVRERHPDVNVVALERNAGAAARNIGAEALDTPYVAFSDDDSWWAEGALCKSAEIFEAHSTVGVVAARILVGPEERLDPTCIEMVTSPLYRDVEFPGRRLLGFIACGAVVRRTAFLGVGGFDERLGIGGEEALLSLDLTSAGWKVCYVDGIVAHHHPSTSRDQRRRRRLLTRNALWTSWLRHPGGEVWTELRAALAAGARDRAARVGIVDAVAGLPWVIGERKRLPAHVQTDLRTLSRT